MQQNVRYFVKHKDFKYTNCIYIEWSFFFYYFYLIRNTFVMIMYILKIIIICPLAQFCTLVCLITYILYIFEGVAIMSNTRSTHVKIRI